MTKRVFLPLLFVFAMLLIGINTLQAADSRGEIYTVGRNVQVSVSENSYQVSYDREGFGRALPTNSILKLRYQEFDPLREKVELPFALTAKESNAYIVQYKTAPLASYQDTIREMGGEIHAFVPWQAQIVIMNEEVKRKVEQQPFVRWIGLYQPAFKVDPDLIPQLIDRREGRPLNYSILVLERGKVMQSAVADRIQQMGGTILQTIPEGFRIEAQLADWQVRSLLHMDEIWFIDRLGAPEDDMDIARQIGGADHIESVGGYTGAGVNGEVMDGNVISTHVDFQSNPVIFHGANSGSSSHGTPVFGIVFGDGTGDATARGMMPDAQGIFADYGELTNRYTHTLELVDPSGPYRAVFQTNSWGSPRDTDYTTISAEMDDILFLYDILITQSQSNAGNQDSRPQAWAKNIVSVGGACHKDTLTTADDTYDYVSDIPNCTGPGEFALSNNASVGPAADGRVKPDLTHFYSQIHTTSNGNDMDYGPFGGTSGATPITGGHFGLFFDMWADGIFGNSTSTGDVFDERPHMTTAKAIMINAANQYTFTTSTDDLNRSQQGWGMASVGNIYDLADNNLYTLIIDESDPIQEMQINSYNIEVGGSGSCWLRTTMTYADPMGNPAATVHRINDLSLRITSPTGTIYWGNNGLNDGNWSTSGGTANGIDTVENIFIQNAESGTWEIDVIANEIVEDARLETAATDADYALVVSQECLTSSPDLSISKTPSGTFTNGGTGSYTIQVVNFGPGSTVGSISVSDILPTGETYSGFSGTGWSCSNSGSLVSCTHAGPLGAFQILPALSLDVSLSSAGTVENCAEVYTPFDGNGSNNQACVIHEIEP